VHAHCSACPRHAASGKRVHSALLRSVHGALTQVCAVSDPPATGTSTHPAMNLGTTKMEYNRVRFECYKRCAKELVDGETYDANELANMLHDVRWAEVPRAFSVALFHAARKGPLRPGLGDEFKKLIDYVTFLAFGSTEREVVQPWYLKNWDDFFVSCVDGILSLNSRADVDELKRREPAIRRAFEGVLELLKGARKYMSLSRLAHSEPVHALLVAAGHSSNSFLWHGHLQMSDPICEVSPSSLAVAERKITLAHVFMMEVVSEAVLATHDDVVISWKRAFGHYAGASRWRRFAQRCNKYALKRDFKALKTAMLEAQVETSYKRARSDVITAVALLDRQNLISPTTGTFPTPPSSQKRKRVEEFHAFSQMACEESQNLYSFLDASQPSAGLCH